MVPTETLAIVLTNGFMDEAAGDLRPSEIGILRMNRAAELLAQDPEIKVCFAGGQRNNPYNSEAEVYARWFRDHYPHLAERISLVSAKAKCTARDMVALSDDLESKDPNNRFRRHERFILISHPHHTRLAKMTLGMTKIGVFADIMEVDSGEPAPYSWPTQIILNVVTYLDPRWERFLSAPLLWKANRRGD